VSHEGLARPGESVRVQVRLSEISGRRLTFAIHAETAQRIISRGTHERVVVDKTRFGSDSSRERA
jgi:fluoroacetyl-CoA thioesterase